MKGEGAGLLEAGEVGERIGVRGLEPKKTAPDFHRGTPLIRSCPPHVTTAVP